MGGARGDIAKITGHKANVNQKDGLDSVVVLSDSNSDFILK
jgi:hypothetical protein